MIKPLEIKKYSIPEISKWFQVCPATVRRNKEQYLRELSEYCKYHIDGQKIVIDKIYIPYYDKEKSSLLFIYVKKHFAEYWDFDNPETCKRVAARMFQKKPEDLKGSFNTMRQYVAQVRDMINAYYSNKQLNEDVPLPVRFKWAKMFCGSGADEATRAANAQYEKFSAEEMDILIKLFNKRHSNVPFAVLETQQKVYEKQIGIEQAWENLCELVDLTEASYGSFLREVAHNFDCDWIVRCTMITRDEAIEALKSI